MTNVHIYETKSMWKMVVAPSDPIEAQKEALSAIDIFSDYAPDSKPDRKYIATTPDTPDSPVSLGDDSSKIEELVHNLTLWIAGNAERESIWLTPSPSWEINVDDLLDKLSELSGVYKSTISKWIDDYAESKLSGGQRWK